MIDVYLLYGPPGVGKGTISEKLPADHCLGTGRILRAQKMALDGNLMPNDYINQLIKREISLKKQYVVIDGYPRTIEQAEFLISLPDINIVRAYALTCPDKILIERLSLRQTCLCGATYHPILKPSKEKNKCDLCGKELFRRADDAPEIVQKRLTQFHLETEPVLEKLKPWVRYIDTTSNFKAVMISVVNEIISEQEQSKKNTRLLQKISIREHD